MTQKPTGLFPQMNLVINNLEVSKISNDRKKTVQPLIDFIQNKIDAEQEVRLNFICTHNSRRSHLSQVWAQALASHFELENVVCYSGGTEATAIFPMVVKTLEKSGFKVEKLSETGNPIYSIKYGANELPVIGFSKTFDHGFNPQSEFAAIMTCSQADAGCPFITGAEKRIPVTFEDPKEFDGTPQQETKYHERSLQIATELFYVFSKIN